LDQRAQQAKGKAKSQEVVEFNADLERNLRDIDRGNAEDGEVHVWLAESVGGHLVSARIRMGGQPFRAEGSACTYSGVRRRVNVFLVRLQCPDR
jgi:hypothetical protein